MPVRKFAVIGHPIGHTMSPFIHKRLFELAGISGQYGIIDIAPQELPGKNDFELIDTLAKLSGTKEPYAITDIRTAPVRHKTVVDAEEMPGTVRNFLGI